MQLKKIFIFVAALLVSAIVYSQKEPVKPSNTQSVKVNNVVRQAPVYDKIAFEAVIDHQQVAPRSPLKFDAVKYNDGNGFSSSDNSFTAPTSGVYSLSLNLNLSGYGCIGGGGSVSVYTIKNGRDPMPGTQTPATSSNLGGFSSGLSFSTRLNAGDKITAHVIPILCSNGTGQQAILYRAYFSGFRVYGD
jgi:hypothetical protein